MKFIIVSFILIIIIFVLAILYVIKNFKFISKLEGFNTQFCNQPCIKKYQNCNSVDDICCNNKFSCQNNKNFSDQYLKCLPNKKNINNCSETQKECNPRLDNPCCNLYDACLYLPKKNKNICTNLCQDLESNIIPNNLKYNDKLIRNDRYKDKNYFIEENNLINLDLIESIGHYGSCCVPLGAYKNTYFGIKKSLNKCNSNGITYVNSDLILRKKNNMKNCKNNQIFICKDYSPRIINQTLYSFGSTNNNIFKYIPPNKNNPYLIGYTFILYLNKSNLILIDKIIIQIIDFKIQNKINLFDLWCPGSPNGNFSGCDYFYNWNLKNTKSLNKINSNNCYNLFKNDSKSFKSCNDVLVDIFQKNSNYNESFNLSVLQISKMKLITTPDILSSISNINFNSDTLAIS